MCRVIHSAPFVSDQVGYERESPGFESQPYRSPEMRITDDAGEKRELVCCCTCDFHSPIVDVLSWRKGTSRLLYTRCTSSKFA